MNEIAIDSPLNFPYTAIDLTAAIDILPNQYGRLNDSGLFPVEGVTTTVVEIRLRDNYLTILPSQLRDAEPVLNRPPEERAIYMEIPHFPMQDMIAPKDLQNMFAFIPGPLRRKTAEDAMNERLQGIRNRHNITFEYLKMTALKGEIKDGRGDVLYNLYTVFGVQKKTVDFDLDDNATDVKQKTYEVARHMELNAKGEVVDGVEALVSREFFDALTSHPNVEKFYTNWSASAQFSGDMRRRFPFGAMVFSEYNAVADTPTVQGQRFIDAGYGHAYPTGTLTSFQHYAGPANHIGMVNQPGPDIFVSPKILDHGKGVELHSESNPLPVMRRPDLLVELVQF